MRYFYLRPAFHSFVYFVQGSQLLFGQEGLYFLGVFQYAWVLVFIPRVVEERLELLWLVLSRIFLFFIRVEGALTHQSSLLAIYLKISLITDYENYFQVLQLFYRCCHLDARFFLFRSSSFLSSLTLVYTFSLLLPGFLIVPSIN